MFDDLTTDELHDRFTTAYDEANQLYGTDEYHAAVERMMDILKELYRRSW